jgi:hypothetical protein
LLEQSVADRFGFKKSLMELAAEIVSPFIENTLTNLSKAVTSILSMFQ